MSPSTPVCCRESPNRCVVARPSGGFVIRLCIAGDELWNVVVRGFRFSKVGFDGLLFFVQRPEGIAEQVRRVVLSLDLDESVPVLPEAGFDLVCGVAATEELEGAVSNHDWDAGSEWDTYAWERTPLRHRL